MLLYPTDALSCKYRLTCYQCEQTLFCHFFSSFIFSIVGNLQTIGVSYRMPIFCTFCSPCYINFIMQSCWILLISVCSVESTYFIITHFTSLLKLLDYVTSYHWHINFVYNAIKDETAHKVIGTNIQCSFSTKKIYL